MPMYDKNVQGSLLAETMRLLKETDKDALTIHKETDLPFYWVNGLLTRMTKDPSVNKIQCLYEYLTNEELNV